MTTAIDRVWTADDELTGQALGQCIAHARAGNVSAQIALEAWSRTHPDQTPPQVLREWLPATARDDMPGEGEWTVDDVGEGLARGRAVAAARAGDRSARAALDEHASRAEEN